MGKMKGEIKMNHNVEFSKIEWTEAAIGFRYKAFISGKQKIRLVEFSEGLKEPTWCKNGHSGYVVEGECKIDFNGKLEYLKKGDVFHIPTSEEDKHMVMMDKGGWVQMVLFEQI